MMLLEIIREGQKKGPSTPNKKKKQGKKTQQKKKKRKSKAKQKRKEEKKNLSCPAVSQICNLMVLPLS